MGTSAITKFADDGDVAFCAFYTQCDGYPSHHGKALKQFLEGFTIVDGLAMEVHDKIANGVECLAAQAIKHFKDGIGHTYMVNPNANWDSNYTYTIKAISAQPITILVEYMGKKLYEGPIKEYKAED